MYLLGTGRDGSVLADNFLTLGGVVCLDGSDDAEVLADGEVELRAGPLEVVDVAVVVELLLGDDFELGFNGLHAGPEARKREF